MFLPLKDKNPLKVVAFQFVTLVFIFLCAAVYLWQASLAEKAEVIAAYSYGMVPTVLFGITELPTEVAALPTELTLVSYMFLHGDLLHLLGNMLFLWVFGDNIEDSMGHFRFIIFYLLCGSVAGLAHALMAPSSVIPLVGASGAIAGLMGGYFILHPKVKILVLVFHRLPLHLPAYLLIIAWMAFQFYNAGQASEGNIAWWAHIGGFIAGVILIIPMRYKQIPLFDRGVNH